jgi:hypothetical protein
MDFLDITLMLMLWSSSAQAHALKASTARTFPKPFVSYCATDGVYSLLPDHGRVIIARAREVELQAEFGPGDDDGATFRFVQRGKVAFSFVAKDLSAPGVWTAIDPAHDQLAITYSDGGAIGGFHVRVFQIGDGGIKDVSKAIQPAVTEFKLRHNCKERRNNVSALRWVSGDLLLLTEVYPTSDCGPDLGHFEGYRVTVPEGKIEEHLTSEQLRRYPGVCLENDQPN